MSNEILEKVFEGVSECKDLKNLTISVFGNKLGNTVGAKIGAVLKHLNKLTNLSIKLEMNEISCQGVESLVEGL